MRALDRKLLRDLWRLKTQALAIAVLGACGVATLSGSVSMYRSLLRTQTRYYEDSRFADVFAALRRAPESVAVSLAAIPGVTEVETRIQSEGNLEVPGLGEPATALVYSVPRDGTPRLNRLHLRAGRPPRAVEEVLASEGFALANRLHAGDALTAVINGRRQRLVIVGVALSPEHLYAMPPGGLLPDDRHFAVLWMSREALAPAMDLVGACNSVTARLAPGAQTRDVLDAFDRVLAPYGGLKATSRADNVSHRFISDELRQLKATAVIVPTIFLGVAAFMLGVILARLIATERQLVGTFKALGYSSLAVGAHYAKLVLCIMLIGAVLGTAGGAWLGIRMARLYGDFYRFPVVVYELEPGIIVLAWLASLLAALAGVAGAVRRAVRLHPAEAMRPEPPATFRRTLLERLGFVRLLSQPARMVLRNLSRRPVRALASALGIAAAVAMLVTGSFFGDAMNYLAEVQFTQTQREDATVTFTTPLAPVALHSLAALPGVRDREPFRAVPVVLRADHRSYRTALMGLSTGARLHRLVDGDGREVAVPPEGIVMSAKLGQILGVRPGAALTVEILEGRRRRGEVRVAALIDDYLGVSATMSLGALNRLAGEGDLVSGAFLSLDAAAANATYARLRTMPRVAGVTLTSAMLHSFRQTMQDYLLLFTSVLVFFAMLIAVGIVYNAGRISLAERERELATLRIIGLTRAETWLILAGELVLLTFLALLPGWALGWGLAAFTAHGLDSDLYRIPVVVSPGTLGFAAVVVLGSTAAVAVGFGRRLARLDLVRVLKTKE